MAMKDSVRHLLPVAQPSQPPQPQLAVPQPAGSQSGVSPGPTPAPEVATATPSQAGTPVPAFETGPPTRAGSPTPAVAVPKTAAVAAATTTTTTTSTTTTKGGANANGDAELLNAVDVPVESSKIPLDVAVMTSLSTAQTEERVKKLVSGLLLVGGTSLIPGAGWAVQSR
jgi:hypothetical protein